MPFFNNNNKDKNKTAFYGLLYAFLATFCWGLTGALIRLLDIQSSEIIIFWRLAIATAVLLPLVIRDRESLAKTFRSPLTLLMALYYILATEAFIHSTIAEVVLIIGLTPLVVIFIQRFYGEKISKKSIFGALITILGLIAFISPSLEEFSENRISGDLLAFGAAIVSAVFAVGLRHRALNDKPVKILSLTFVTFCYGTLLSCGMIFVKETSLSTNISSDDIVILVALGIISTVLPTIFFGVAASRLPSVTTSSFTLLTPLWAALIGGVLISEWPLLLSIPGAFITLAGLWLIIRKT